MRPPPREEGRITSCGREAATICPAPVTLTFDLLTLKVVSESLVTWATCVPILVFLGLSILELFPMYRGGAPIGAGGHDPLPSFRGKGDGRTKLTLKTQR